MPRAALAKLLAVASLAFTLGGCVVPVFMGIHNQNAVDIEVEAFDGRDRLFRWEVVARQNYTVTQVSHPFAFARDKLERFMRVDRVAVTPEGADEPSIVYEGEELDRLKGMIQSWFVGPLDVSVQPAICIKGEALWAELAQYNQDARQHECGPRPDRAGD